MRIAGYKTATLLLFGALGLVPTGSPGQHKQKPHSKEKTVWNYNGGVLFITDGTLPNGVCFRVYGRMTSEHFFDHLQRIDTEEGTVFRQGTETVTNFPEAVIVSYAIRDQLCPSGMQQVGTRRYLTEEMIEKLSLSLYWKHGVELRVVNNSKLLDAQIDRISPYAASLAADLPRRYEWSYELEVPSAGVALSDGLAFVFRTPDGRIAARVAARL